METIAVIGLGSMGKRRIRLLKNQLGKKVIGIDTNIERLTEVTEIFHIPCYSSIELALNNHNIFAAVVSTSPLSHATIIHTLLDKKIHVFSEIKPLLIRSHPPHRPLPPARQSPSGDSI